MMALEGFESERDSVSALLKAVDQRARRSGRLDVVLMLDRLCELRDPTTNAERVALINAAVELLTTRKEVSHDVV